MIDWALIQRTNLLPASAKSLEGVRLHARASHEDALAEQGSCDLRRSWPKSADPMGNARIAKVGSGEFSRRVRRGRKRSGGHPGGRSPDRPRWTQTQQKCGPAQLNSGTGRGPKSSGSRQSREGWVRIHGPVRSRSSIPTCGLRSATNAKRRKVEVRGRHQPDERAGASRPIQPMSSPSVRTPPNATSPAHRPVIPASS